MRHDVRFPGGDSTLAGHLYVPEGIEPGERRSAVVVVAPGSGIKEQASGRYAKELSDRGLIALAFDHRSYGESEGYPRYDEDPYSKVDDIKHAVSFLGNRAEVDANGIGTMGICGGGGYAPYAAATDRRIKAVATVSGMFNQRGAFEEMAGGDPAVTHAVLEASNSARQAFSRGEPALYGAVIPGPDSPHVIEPLREAPSYYFDESVGAHPRWENKVLAWSLEKQLTFNALDVINLISPNPLLLIVGTKSGSRVQNEQAYSAACEPKELMFVEGATHIDLYHVDEYVKQAANRLAEFFAENLRRED